MDISDGEQLKKGDVFIVEKSLERGVFDWVDLEEGEFLVVEDAHISKLLKLVLLIQ